MCWSACPWAHACLLTAVSLHGTICCGRQAIADLSTETSSVKHACIAKHASQSMRFQCMLTVAGLKSAVHSQMTKMSIRGATHAHDLTLSACTSVSVMIKLSALCAVCNYAHASAHPECTVQEQYEAVCKKLFDDLDKLEKRLDGQRYLIPYYPGGRATPCPTLADYRLFTTLIRFDIAYYPLFKTNLKHIRDYPNLQVKPQCPLSALRRTQLCFTWML